MTALSLEQRIERLEAALEIQNVLGKYTYFLAAGKFDDIVELFARKTPGVSSEVSAHGLYEGFDGVKEFYEKHVKFTYGDGTGWLAEHYLTSPVIEIASDGQSAKGLWAVPGARAGIDKKTGKPKADWLWTRNAVHFVREDGEWKILRMHIYGVFATPYEEGWGKVQWGGNPRKAENTTYFRPYNPANKPEYVPAAPEPYDTYTPDTPLP